MGVDWKLTLRELSEAVPPAFTEHVGRQFAKTLQLTDDNFSITA